MEIEGKTEAGRRRGDWGRRNILKIIWGDRERGGGYGGGKGRGK